MTTLPLAPPLQVSRWFNSPGPLELAALRGRVVMLHAFQMLCPGCVSHGLPQAERVRELFPPDQLAVVGLHSVFEHHHAMGDDALAAFLHEYRVGHPVAVDRHDGEQSVPLTMRAYGLRGTPSLLLIDRDGRLRQHWFGRIDDLQLGVEIGRLLGERTTENRSRAVVDAPAAACDEHGCALPASS
jgi:hypothetical protein